MAARQSRRPGGAAVQNDPSGMSQEELEQRYKEVSGETERLIMDQFREMWKSGNLVVHHYGCAG